MSALLTAFENDDQRERAVAAIMALTATIPPAAAHRYQQQLVLRYQRGELTIEQVTDLLNASVYQVLYRSRAAYLPSEAQLEELLHQSRHFNNEHQVTGLLLYSEGHFVQVLEGPAEVIQPLYGRIQQDPRHTQVETVSEGPIPARRFAAWSMNFGHAKAPELEHVLDTIQEKEPVPGVVVTSAHLQALLEAFIS